MPMSGPDKCPECGHEPLLPLSPGNCPECGFEYDQDTLIWRPRRPWRIYLLFVNTLIFLPWLFRFLQVVVLLRQWPTTPVVLGALASLTTLGWALPRIRVLLSEGHRYAAVTPRGIQARTPRNAYTIPWEDLGEVTVLLGVPRVKQRGRSGVCELDWIFDTDQEVRDFLAKIEEARWRHQTAATAP
ncbi:MAG: hypothetical protein ACE5I3_04550 [Phycisphaerae bacterium]